MVGRSSRFALGIAIVTMVVWLSGVRGGYHFDDALTPVSDPASQSLGAWVEHLPDTLRPVTKLTYALEASLGLADDPPARRATDVMIHALTAALLCMLLLALVPALEPAGAAALALLWAVHPVHAEAVLAIAGRSAGLANALVIAALLAHVRDRPKLAALLLALAGLARETAIAAVIAIVALELATPRGWRVHARRLVPAAMATIVVVVWLVATPRARELADFSFHGRPLGVSIVHQLAAVPVGLSLYVRPWALSIDHGTALPAWLAAVGGGLYVLAAAAVIAMRHRATALAVGLALWLGAIIPTQSIVPKLDALTERPLALALAGLVVAVATWVARRRRAIVVLAPVIAALAIATVARGQLYRSDLLLWADAAAKSETNARPYMNHALFLHLDGRDRDALVELDRAHAIDPFDPRITAKRDALAEELSRAR